MNLRFGIGLGYSIDEGGELPRAAQLMTATCATIITRNEEYHIGGAIASLSCCDEVIVVDSQSTDRTREIAES